MRPTATPRVDRQRLTTDPDFGREVAAAIGKQLLENPPVGNSVDEVEAEFTAAIMRTAEIVMPLKERKRPGRGWSGDAETQAELSVVETAMHTAWRNLKENTKDTALRRAVRQACKGVKRVREAAVIRFFERYVQEMEEQLRRRDQRGFFQRLKSMEVEETRKVQSQYIRDEDGKLLRDKELISQRWVRFFHSLLNAKSEKMVPDIFLGLPQQPTAHDLGVEPTEEEVAVALRAMANSKAAGTDDLPAELLTLGLRQDRTILRELYSLTTYIWREGKVPQRWKDATIMALHKTKDKRTTAAFLSCPMWVRYFLT